MRYECTAYLTTGDTEVASFDSMEEALDWCYDYLYYDEEIEGVEVVYDGKVVFESFALWGEEK